MLFSMKRQSVEKEGAEIEFKAQGGDRDSKTQGLLSVHFSLSCFRDGQIRERNFSRQKFCACVLLNGLSKTRTGFAFNGS